LRKYTIGPYGRITLAMARGQVQKIFAARVDGRDPAAEKQQAKRRLVADRTEELIEAFIVQHVSRCVPPREWNGGFGWTSSVGGTIRAFTKLKNEMSSTS
jgi:hypothetical protein